MISASNINLYNYGRRFYNSQIGRWLEVDSIADNYVDYSGYNYVMNNPINAIDPDGKFVFFVNGYMSARKYKELKKKNVSRWESKFIVKMREHLGRHESYWTPLIKHGFFSSAKRRQKKGFAWAKKNFEETLSHMKKNETIKIVAHSMGGSFAAGMKEFYESQGINVEVMVMINIYQPGKINLEDDHTTVIESRITNDPLLGILDVFGKSSIKGADISLRRKSERLYYGHVDPINDWFQNDKNVEINHSIVNELIRYNTTKTALSNYN